MKLMGIGHEYIQKSTPEDNGDIESFHSSLKTDYILVTDLETFEDAKKLMKYAFSDYIRTRPYSSIDYLPPEEFERRWMNDEDFRKEFLGNKRRKGG
jgi:transposase InsO family protein